MYEETTIKQEKNFSIPFYSNNYGQIGNRLDNENIKLKDELSIKLSELETLKKTNETHK